MIIIPFLFEKFCQVFEEQTPSENLIQFCKFITPHEKSLGLFINIPDEEKLKHFLSKLEETNEFNIKQINPFCAEILVNELSFHSINTMLFSFISKWQKEFSHDQFQTQNDDYFENTIKQSSDFFNKIGNEYLNTFIENPDCKISIQLEKQQLIHAMGLQQNIKLTWNEYKQQDLTWLNNISQSALVLAILSHNFEQHSQALRIKYELLTSETNLNPKLKLKQLLNNQANIKNNWNLEISHIFLKFEFKALNAFAFHKPYKLLQAIIELERALIKNNAF